MALLRFAPSPTGPLHLGGLRMALYNYLYAKKHGGKWMLRIEDTHAQRVVPGAVDGIRHVLDWAGLDYDYGPGKEGPHGPYYQSERLDLYRSYSNRLLDSGVAYRCFCSEDKLAATREHLARSRSNASYDKTCLHLSDEEVARKVRAGEKFTVRLNDGIPPERKPIKDRIFGEVGSAHGSLATDPILMKSDSSPTYHLASVVDDHEMGITHVLRGEEWVTSLPLHLDLYAHLKLTPPEFAHFPILLNADGSKMSKRNGDVQVIDYVRRGWDRPALLNWLALAGWGVHHGEDPTASHDAPQSTKIMQPSELIAEFELGDFTRRNSSLDITKLEYISKRHLKLAWSTPEGLTALAVGIHEKVKEAFPSSPYTSVENIKKVINLLEIRTVNIQDVITLAPYCFIDPDLTTDEAVAMKAKLKDETRLPFLESCRTTLESLKDEWQTADLLGSLVEERKRAGLSKKESLTVIRHALTGTKDGPPISDMMRFLGPERTIERLR